MTFLSEGGSMTEFDYESKVWGSHDVKVEPTYLGALRLQYCLEDLRTVQGKVLEVGCGAGGMARAIKSYRPDLDVYGCDISRNAIRDAKKRPGGVTFDLGDAYDIPFDDDSFSAVVMFDVLEHLEDPDASVNEIYRVIDEGGLLHLFVPCEGALYTLHGLLAKAGWRAKEHYGGHIQHFRLDDVKALLEQSCFEVRNHRWSGHLVNQLVDAAYFTALSLRGRNTPTSVEGYLKSENAGITRTAVAGLKDVVSIASNVESKLLWRFPGFGVHFRCEKPIDHGIAGGS